MEGEGEVKTGGVGRDGELLRQRGFIIQPAAVSCCLCSLASLHDKDGFSLCRKFLYVLGTEWEAEWIFGRLEVAAFPAGQHFRIKLEQMVKEGGGSLGQTGGQLGRNRAQKCLAAAFDL